MLVRIQAGTCLYEHLAVNSCGRLFLSSHTHHLWGAAPGALPSTHHRQGCLLPRLPGPCEGLRLCPFHIRLASLALWAHFCICACRKDWAFGNCTAWTQISTLLAVPSQTANLDALHSASLSLNGELETVPRPLGWCKGSNPHPVLRTQPRPDTQREPLSHDLVT